MKKEFLLSIFCCCLLNGFLFAARISDEEGCEIVRKASCESLPDVVKTFLQRFFADESIKERILTTDRFPQGQPMTREQFESRAQSHGQRLRTVPNLLRNWGLESVSHNTFVFKSEESEGDLSGWVIKIAMCDWFPPELRPERCLQQNVSRVFYAIRIDEFVEREGFIHIRPVKKMLVSTTGGGVPERFQDVTDDNCAVVCERMVSYDGRSIKDFKGLITEDSDEGALALVAEALILVREFPTALWNVASDGNVMVVAPYQIAFVDTEKPGLGSVADADTPFGVRTPFEDHSVGQLAELFGVAVDALKVAAREESFDAVYRNLGSSFGLELE